MTQPEGKARLAARRLRRGGVWMASLGTVAVAIALLVAAGPARDSRDALAAVSAAGQTTPEATRQASDVPAPEPVECAGPAETTEGARGEPKLVAAPKCVVAGTTASAGESCCDGDCSCSFVLRAGKLYPVTADQPGPIPNGMMIVRRGRIVAVGRGLEVPRDLKLIDLPDAVVCPGLVSAGCAFAGRHVGDETVSAAYRAIDTYDPYFEYKYTLSRGTTTVHLDPGGHRLVSGLGAVVKLGGPCADRTLRPASDLTITLGAFDPPVRLEKPFYPSADVMIESAEMQRPDSRLGQFLELDERIAEAEAWNEKSSAPMDADFDLHERSFVRAWASKLPLRIQVHRVEDIEGALSFVRKHDRAAYLVGLTEADPLVRQMAEAGLPMVVRIEHDYMHPSPDVGEHPNAMDPRLETAGGLASSSRIALAGREGDGAEDLRMSALIAMRGGMPADAALAAITRVPAEILGVEDRVGSLAPGRDADFLVFNGDPLSITSHVSRVYVGGHVAYEAPESSALVVRGGTVWIGDGRVLHDGEVLIEDGEIKAVGQRVPHPQQARVIDAGADAFITPGFIDAYGHLGLAGDRSRVGVGTRLHKILGFAGPVFDRVARAGITTVMMAPYRSDTCARIVVVKTQGDDGEALIGREVGGVHFACSPGKIKKLLEGGKKYVAEWKKYEEELEKWKKGDVKKDEKKPAEEAESVEEDKKPDPITGVWETKLSGGPIPEPVTATMRLRLGEDNTIEGRLTGPDGEGEEVQLTGKLEGDKVTIELDQETPVGRPVLKATLDAEDHMKGAIEIAQFKIDVDATRTDKGPVEFKVSRKKRKKGDDGRPEAPAIDENWEPFRPLLAGKIPAVVEAHDAARIDAVIKLIVEEYKLPLVLIGAGDAATIMEKVEAHKDKLGVVVPPKMVVRRDRKPYNQMVDMSRRGIPVALQSNAEDGARGLPLMGLFAVREGMGGDAALRALTIDAARMYKLDDRVGTLQAGRDGDVLIFDGHPFDAGSRLRRVIVGGNEVPNE